MNKEIWKDYIYHYQVSNFGRLKNKKTNNILKLRPINKKGYLGTVVTLGNKKLKKMIIIHRAVAECFIPNPNNYPQVNHINGIKSDNSYLNLEWCTAQQNVKHAMKNNLLKTKGEDNNNSKLSNQDRIWIKEHCIKNDKLFGARALAKRFKVTHQCILRIISENK